MILIGLYRLIAGHGFVGHFFLTFFNTFGLMILGILLVLGVFMKLNKTFILLFGALLYEIAIEEHVIDAVTGRRLAYIMVYVLLAYFLYRFLRLTFYDAWRDAKKRKTSTIEVAIVKDDHLLKPDHPYHSHLENKAFLLRDMAKSKNNSLVGYEGCWGTRWHFGPLWFENFFGDAEPPSGKDGPLRVVIWQPLHDVPATKGWKQTKLLKYNHMTGFATIDPTNPTYWSNWDEHAKRHVKKWRASTEWEVYHPSLEEFIAGYKRSQQNVLLKFYFVNLTKQLMENHRETLVFFGVRRRDTPNAPMIAGFICHDIPEAKQSRHLISFIHPSAKSSPAGIGLMDEWFKHSILKGWDYLDFGVFWMEGDPESWKGFSRFKGQFGITYIKYPPARFKRAGSIQALWKK